jgi:hypothetical protein
MKITLGQVAEFLWVKVVSAAFEIATDRLRWHRRLVQRRWWHSAPGRDASPLRWPCAFWRRGFLPARLMWKVRIEIVARNGFDLLRWLFSADFFNDTAISCRSFEAKTPLSRSRASLFWVTWSDHLRVSLAGYRCLLPSVCDSRDQQSHGLLEQHTGGRTDWDAHEHRAHGLPTNRAPGARKIESMIVSIKRSCSHGSHKNTHWTLSACAALRHVCSQHRHTWAHLRKCLWCSA